MRPCTNCRSEATEPLDQGLLARLVSTLGGEPLLRAWVCSVCRHVDFWVDQPVLEQQPAAEQAGEVEPGAVAAPAT